MAATEIKTFNWSTGPAVKDNAWSLHAGQSSLRETLPKTTHAA